MAMKEFSAVLVVAVFAGLLGGMATVYLFVDHSVFAEDSAKRLQAGTLLRVIEAEGFQVVDKEGKPRAHLGVGEGKTNVMLGYDPNKSRATLSTLPDGSAALSIIGPDGKSTSLSWDAGGLMGLMFFDKKQTRRMALTTDADGATSLVFYDKSGKVLWTAP